MIDQICNPFVSHWLQVIRCKKGKAGMHCMKTLQAVLIAMFEDPIQPPQVASIVESLGEYLISMTYWGKFDFIAFIYFVE